MPAAAVTAVGAVAVGAMQHSAANKAANAQKEAAGQAYQYQAHRDDLADADKKTRWDAYQRDLAEWKVRHGYGTAPAAGGGGKVQPNYGGAPPAGQTGGGWASPMGQSGTLQDLAQQPTSMGADLSSGQGRTLQELAGWNDWRTQGLEV